MKFIISSASLLKGLQKISGIMSTSNVLPILDNFLFELNENKDLSIRASDLETTIISHLQVDMAEGSGKIAIPSKILLETMKTLPDLPVTMIVNMENQAVELLAGEGKYKMAGSKADEFPEIPVLEDSDSVEFTADILVNAFNKTIFATGNDETRPVMRGVFCEITPEHVSFVATDAHKLVRYRRHDIKTGKEAKMVLPPKPLNHMRSILPDDEEVKVTFEFSEKNARFRFDDTTIVSRLIDGRYPNYESVIPVDNPFKLLVDRKSLMGALRRVSIFGSRSTHLIRFKISGQELLISAQDSDLASEAHERLTCNYDGDDLEIGFNSRFMQEMLANLDTENIEIELSQPNRPGIIHPEGNNYEGEDILMLLMPLMLAQR